MTYYIDKARKIYSFKYVYNKSMWKYYWPYRKSNCAKKVRLQAYRILLCKIKLERAIVQVIKYKPGPFKDSINNLRYIGREHAKKWFGKNKLVRRFRGVGSLSRVAGKLVS